MAQVLTRIPLSKIRIRSDEEGQLNPASRTRNTTALQDSIKQHGLLVPINVVHIPDEDVYMLTDGDQRRTAVTALGWKDIPALVETNNEDAFLKMVAANLHKPYTPLELAKIVRRLASPPHKQKKTRIAISLGIPVTKVNLLLDLLEAAPDVQAKVNDGRMSLTSFKPIAKESKARQEQVVEEVVTKNPDGKITTQVVRAARQRIETEEKGTRIAGDQLTIAQEFSLIRKHIQHLTSLAPFSEAEKMKATYNLGEVVKDLKALKEAM